METTYKSHGMVIGKCWGGGKCGFQSIGYLNTSLDNLKNDIIKGIKGGGIDSGMGFEKVVGAVMVIETIRTHNMKGRVFKNVETCIENFGEVTPLEEESMMEAIYNV